MTKLVESVTIKTAFINENVHLFKVEKSIWFQSPVRLVFDSITNLWTRSRVNIFTPQTIVYHQSSYFIARYLISRYMWDFSYEFGKLRRKEYYSEDLYISTGWSKQAFRLVFLEKCILPVLSKVCASLFRKTFFFFGSNRYFLILC